MLNNDAIDDVPVPDGTPQFAGGMASFPPRNTLQPHQFRLGINTMIEQVGVLQTRRGFSYLSGLAQAAGSVQGLGYLETTAGVKKLLACYSSGICKLFDGTVWNTAAGYTPLGGYFAEIVQGNDRLYVSDGTQNMRSWDGSSFTDLGNGALDAPRARFLVWGTNRLIAAGVYAAPDTVFFSNFLTAASGQWPATSQIRVGAGDGNPITGLAMWTKTLLAVFKRTKVYIVDINPTVSVSSFVIEEVPGELGCVSHRTIAKVGADLWFLSNNGVRSLGRILSGADQQVSASISLPVENRLRTLSDVGLLNTSAAFFRGRFLLAGYADVPEPPDWPNSGYFLLSYNKTVEQWEGNWRGVAAGVQSCWTQTRFGGNLRLVCGTWGGDVLYWRHPETGTEVAADYQDDGATSGQPIATTIGTRGHVFGAEFNQKQGFALEVEFGASTADAVTIAVNPDEGTDATLSSATVPAGKVALTLLHQPPFRALAVNLSSTAKKLAVRSVKLSAFMNTMPVGQ